MMKKDKVEELWVSGFKMGKWQRNIRKHVRFDGSDWIRVGSVGGFIRQYRGSAQPWMFIHPAVCIILKGCGGGR